MFLWPKRGFRVCLLRSSQTALLPRGGGGWGGGAQPPPSTETWEVRSHQQKSKKPKAGDAGVLLVMLRMRKAEATKKVKPKSEKPKSQKPEAKKPKSQKAEKAQTP